MAIVLVVSPLARAQSIDRVDMIVQPLSDRLSVRLHVPASVLTDARLPRLPDGTLDDTVSAEPLQIVAAEIARSLDLRQGNTAIPVAAVSGAVGSDRTSVDVALTYTLVPGAGSISARVNAIQSTRFQLVQTIVEFRGEGPPRTFTASGAPTRLVFDPSALETIVQFVTHALGAVLSSGDHLLMLALLLVVARASRDSGRLVATALAGQAPAAVAWLLLPATSSVILLASGMAAASLVVMAAIQNVVRARLSWVWLTAAAFGVLNGVTFADTFLGLRPYAGDHANAAAITFLLVVVLAEIWLGGVFWLTRRWLDARLSERTTVVIVSLLCAHTALHHVDDWAEVLAQVATVRPDQVMAGLVIVWAALMAVAALVEASRQRRDAGNQGRAGRVSVS